jgi:hypothetical protein
MITSCVKNVGTHSKSGNQQRRDMIEVLGIVLFIGWLIWVVSFFKFILGQKRAIDCQFCNNDMPIILSYYEDVNWGLVCDKHLEVKGRIDALERELFDDDKTDFASMVKQRNLEAGRSEYSRVSEQRRIVNLNIPPASHDMRLTVAGYDIVDGYGRLIERIDPRSAEYDLLA